MTSARQQKYFIFSVFVHLFILAVLLLGFDFSTPLPVLENTNKNDVMSAVILGDVQKSKILPQNQLPKLSLPKPELSEKLNTPKKNDQTEKDAIALKIANDKKIAAQKALEAKKREDLFAKNLLSDIKKVHEKQKQVKQKELKTQFQKTLREQAEKTMRQQLLNEEIKLQGTQSRQAQGEVNKYKALILQAISEHWIVPPAVNKNLYCMLMIRLAPGGLVLDVTVTKTSGDPSLDSSVRAAVLKASPLPVPGDASAFEPFRQFVLKVKPENIMPAFPA